MTTIEIINIIGKRNEDIEAFQFHYFPSQKLIQEQLTGWNTEEQSHFDMAIKIRNELHLPFWDSIMVKAFDNPNYSTTILEAALHHNHSQSKFLVKTEDIPYSSLLHNNSNERIAVCSSIIMKDKQNRHIPMLDFHIPASDINLDIVENVCKILGFSSGYILNSGESYHFISSAIMSWNELYIVLCKALRFCPIIDRAWISHQLEEQSCSLRINKKNGIMPIVVRVIHN